MATLAKASEAAQRGEWAVCLGQLLALWRTARDPDLARVIERVSPRASGPAVTGGSSVAKAVAKRIANADETDVGPILELALTQVRTFPRAYRYVVQLAGAVAPDPRIASALASLIESCPWAGVNGALQGDVVEALGAIDDPRYRRLILDAAAALEPQRGRIRKYRRDLDTLVEVATAIEKLRPPKQPAGLPAAIEAIDRALADTARAKKQASKNADELFAAVYADPADTSLRLVLADALQEKGDPRGEFIALQCG